MRRCAVVAVFALCGCAAPKAREPLGALPAAVTSAQPLWIPFRIRAGKRVAADPREAHFAELRRLTFDGNAGVPVWDKSGLKLRYATQGDCRAIDTIDLGNGNVERSASDTPLSAIAAAGTLVSRCREAQAEISSCWAPAGMVSGTVTMVADQHACELAALHAGKTRPLAAGAGVYGLSASSDGKRIAFYSKRDGDAEIYTAASDGSGVERITRLTGHDVAPRFSGDNSQLVWHAGREGGELHVWIAGAQGARPRQVTKDGKNNSQPSFLPDSRRIVYASDRDSTKRPPTFALYYLDPDGPVTGGGGPRIDRVSYGDGIEGTPIFSPDGSWLAFLSSRGGAGMDLYVARWLEEP